MDAQQRFASEVGRLRANAGWSLAKLGAAAHVDRSYVHNVASGRRWPSRTVAQGLDRALGADGALLTLWTEGDAESRLLPSRRSRTGRAEVNPDHDLSKPWRPDFAGVADGCSTVFDRTTLDRPVLDWVIGNSAPPIDAVRSGLPVTDEEVRIAADMLALMRRLDHTYGAGNVRRRAVSYFATEIDGLLSRPPSNQSTEALLLTVAAGLCEMIGYQSVDVGNNRLATHYYLAGLRFAETSGDRAYGAHLISANIAHLALHAGHPGDALRMATAAQQEISKTSSPAVRSANFAVEARAHAQLGDEKDCTIALVKAESNLARSDPNDEPSWIAYFSPADLEDEVAHCMHDLGRHDQTQRIARAAVADLDPARVRRRAIDTTLLATSLATSGQVEEACAVGRDAVALASRTQSARTMTRLVDMRQALGRYRDQRNVAELKSLVRQALSNRN